jgi:DNA-binding YbaB/EbfC family protein
MFDMMNMLGKVKEVQAKMQKAKADLVNITLTSESGAGMVKVTVNGHRKVLKLEIDPELIKTEDKQTVEDLTVAAINKAMEDVEVKIKEELKKSTDGVLPNIPGLDLGNLL